MKTVQQPYAGAAESLRILHDGGTAYRGWSPTKSIALPARCSSGFGPRGPGSM